MAKKELTCSFYVNGERVEKLSPEHIQRLCDALSESMSEYYTLHPDEFEKV